MIVLQNESFFLKRYQSTSNYPVVIIWKSDFVAGSLRWGDIPQPAGQAAHLTPATHLRHLCHQATALKPPLSEYR